MSHTPSYPGTPRSHSHSLRRTPSRLSITPSLRPSPSLTSLHIHSHSVEAAIPPVPLLPTYFYNTLDSSASSMITMDTNEGILLQDGGPETEDSEDISAMRLGSDVDRSDEVSKQVLRDQLRRALSYGKTPRPGPTISRPASQGKLPETYNIPFDAVSRYSPREYYVLTDAGKPVFIRRTQGDSSDNVTATIGVMQALISVFLDDNDKLRCINAGRTRIIFLLRPPLYYVCVSSWGEPESVTRSHLEYLHLQILSIVTAAQLRRIFERRTNFDLRRLLNGAEGFLTSLLDRLEFDLAMSTSSLHCLKLDSALRKRAAEALVPTSKMKDILYVILVAKGRVVALIRPRKHSIHPADIHILLNTMHSPSIMNSPASSSWIPVCLPKFNPSGFVNAYISFLRKVDSSTNPPAAPMSDGSDDESTVMTTPTQNFVIPGYAMCDDLGLSLVCISGGGDFDTIRSWCNSVTQRLEEEGTLDAIAAASTSGKIEYSVSDLRIPGLRHFIYKSRSHIQITAPMFEDPYDDLNDRKRLLTLYQTLHDAIHAKSGQDEVLKLQYIKTEKESVMGWITQPFELYIALMPRLPKTAAVGAANSVVRWVRKEEAKLFLKDAPVF